MSPAREILVLRPAYPWPWLAALAGVTLILAVASYWTVYRRIRPRTRAGLVALRLLAVATLVACMAGPVLSRTETIVERGTAIIAVDASKSMNISDGGGPTRHERAAAAIAESGETIEELAGKLDLKTVAFASGAAEADLARPADGASTDLAGLLEFVTREGGVDCAGAVIISDGRDTAGGDVLGAAARLGKMGLAVYTVPVGSDRTPEDFLDVRIDSFSCPQKAFVRNRITVTADLATVLPAAHEVKVTFKVDGRAVGNPVVQKVGLGRRTRKVTFEYTPETLGVHRAEIAAEPVDNERNVENNVARTFFRVFGSRLKVLYIEGALRYDFKFLRRTLAGARNVDVEAVTLFREGGRGLPGTADGWKALRVLVLGDVPASRMDPAALARIPKFVEEGGALLVIGGRGNLGPGGYASTPLAKVLPVRIDPADEVLDGPMDIRLTGDGRRHPLLRVADDEELSERLWGRLPELRSVTGVTGVKETASVLLTAGPRVPLMVIQDFGAGRTAVFLTDESWRWVFAEEASPELHRRFWRQVIAHLAHNDYGERGRPLLIETDKMRYLKGERASVLAWVGATGGQAEDFTGAKVVATVGLPGGSQREIELGAGPGEHAAKLRLSVPGDYVVAARLLSAAGAEIGTDETRFTVIEIDLEDENPAADPALMAEMAKLSGGATYPPERLGEAIERLKSRDVSKVKSVERIEAVWNGPWAAAVFMLLLSAEWALRKRTGLA